MRNIVRGSIWTVAAVAVAMMAGAVVDAYQLIASPKELQSSPLQIVGYQRADAHTLRYLQLTNTGDEPLDLNDWAIELNLEGDNVLPPTHGYLLPGEHTVVAGVGEPIVSDAGHLKHNSTEKTLERIAVYPPEDTLYTTDIYTFKSTAATKTSPEITTQSWRRTMSAKNVYSTTLTSFEASDDVLYYEPLYLPPVNAHLLQVVEVYPYSHACSPANADVLCRDYVKLYNPTVEEIPLDEYALRTDSNSSSRTASNTFHLTGKTIGPGEYLSISETDTGTDLSLTNSGGYVWLEDTWGLVRYDATITAYDSAGIDEQGMSWAQNDDGVWRWTSTPKPFAANAFPPDIHTELEPVTLAECPAGKYRNPETNRCRSIEEAVNALAACPEGQVRNPETNRCRSMVLAASALVPCKEGQERNPETNRCRTISSAIAELIPCDEGYERNPATNRCRKVAGEVSSPSSNLATVAAVPLAKASADSLKAILLASIAACALCYGLYEWRAEVGQFLRRLLTHWRG